MVTKNGKIKRTKKPKYMPMPGEIIKGPSVVVCTAPLKEGGSLVGSWEYTVVTRRKENGDWDITVKWWDSLEAGHITRLPDGVCKTIFRHQREIIQDSKKIRGQKAFQTAKRNAELAEADHEPGNIL
jgi:hypothetical protein